MSRAAVSVLAFAFYLFVLGYYYLRAARGEMTDFIRLTVHGRMSVIVFFSAFVALGLAKPQLILFGVVDLACAAWTFLALRADAAAAPVRT